MALSIYGTTSAVVFVCVGGGVTSVETRLSVPDFVSQLWRKFGEKLEIKCRTESLSLSHASLIPRLALPAAFRLQPGEPGNKARAVQFIGGPPGF